MRSQSQPNPASLPMINNSEDLQGIVDFFHWENVVLCGSLADFYWLNWSDVKDFDMEVEEQLLLRRFGLTTSSPKILQDDFGIYLCKTKAFPRFYHGLFNKSKVDFFLKDHKVSGQVVDGAKFNLSCPVQIDSPEIRVNMLKATLNFSPHNQRSTWFKTKKQEAKEKILLYREAFPEMFKIKIATRK
jgi:hypothetical protein